MKTSPAAAQRQACRPRTPDSAQIAAQTKAQGKHIWPSNSTTAPLRTTCMQRQCNMSPSPHAVRPRRRERGDDERRRQMPGNQSRWTCGAWSQLLHCTGRWWRSSTAAPLLQHRRRRREHRLPRAGLFGGGGDAWPCRSPRQEVQGRR